jgi:transcription elongation factor Elf1
MNTVDLNEIAFQCPNCGHDLTQTIGDLKVGGSMVCSSCGIGIDIDTDRLAKASEEIQKSISRTPPRISIKFFR